MSNDGVARGRGVRRATALLVIVTMTLAVLAISVPSGSAKPTRGGAAQAARGDGTFDVRARATAMAVGPRVAAARVTLAKSMGRLGVIQSDPTTGTLRFVGRLDGYLTGPSSRSASSIALGYVRDQRVAFGLRGGDLRTLHLTKDYVDDLGTHHLSYVQRAGGLTLFGQGLRANVARDGRLINVNGGPMRGLRAPASGARIDANAAITAARRGRGGAAFRQGHDTAKLALFPSGRGARLAWKTTTFVSSDEIDLSFVDAQTGAVLYRNNLTDAGIATDTGTADAWPFYKSTIPPNGGGDLTPVTFPVFSANPFGIGAPGEQLLGPNAWVFKDVKDDSFPDPGDAIFPTSGDDFDYPTDFFDDSTAAQNCAPERECSWDKNVAKSWQANLAHNAVQVYYFLNNYHDHLAAAPISFTDAAGNFEFGGTGGDDMVLGNASDGANTDHGFPDLQHVDNANMSTFPDGTPPIMQMYLFKKLPNFGLPTIPSANGGDDAEVVYHEYTHGLSNRLVIYPDGNSGLDNQQAGSMGEAWSDWYAEDFLNNEGYKPDTAAEGLVVMGELTFAGVLRSQPVDCPAEDNSSGRCPGGFDTDPGGYTYGDFGHITTFDGVHPTPEVHADGEIWLETLWDLRMALDTNGFTDGGSADSEELVTRAMELSPPSPSFLDMRNAILQADVVANGGANEDAIWQVFADRGMGYFASSVGGGDTSPVEDFSTPPDCGVDPCSDVSGTVTDKDTGDPIAGATVGFSGLSSGFGFDLADDTDGSGDYLIQDVPDHTYPAWVFSADGYETGVTKNLVVSGGSATADKKLNRDWAALSAGAVLKKFTPPDYADFCGANANGAFDLNVGSGWPSDAVDAPDGFVSGPKKAVVRLPDHIDISSFGVASGGTCGDDSTAGFKHFQIQTRQSKDAPWKTAVDAKAKSDGVLHTFKGSKGLKNVQTIRFVMLSNHGDPFFMDALEVTVRGAPH